jgi:hypothetical protein
MSPSERLPLHNDEKVFTWYQVGDDLKQGLVYVVAALTAEIFCLEGAGIIYKGFNRASGIALGVSGSGCLLFLLLERLKTLRSVVGKGGRCFAMLVQALCMVAIEAAVLGWVFYSIDKKTCYSYDLGRFSLPYPCRHWSLKPCYFEEVPVPCAIYRVGWGAFGAMEMVFLTITMCLCAPCLLVVMSVHELVR